MTLSRTALSHASGAQTSITCVIILKRKFNEYILSRETVSVARELEEQKIDDLLYIAKATHRNLIKIIGLCKFKQKIKIIS